MLKNLVIPLRAKLLVGLALVYLISPLDFIPDLVPGLGLVDDFLIVPTLLFMALKAVLKESAASKLSRR